MAERPRALEKAAGRWFESRDIFMFRSLSVLRSGGPRTGAIKHEIHYSE